MKLKVFPTKKRTRLVIVLVAAIALVSLGLYGFYSVQSWREYEGNYLAWQSAAKKEVDASFALPIDTPEEYEQKLQSLKDINIKLEGEQGAICSGRPLTGWQSGFGAAKDLRDHCQDVAKEVNELTGTLTEVLGYLQGEYTLRQLLGSATGSYQSEESWTGAVASWQKTRADVEKMSSNASFASTKEITVIAVKGVESAWNELLAAHVAKDKPRFIKAKAGLSSAYDGLGAISVKNDQQMAALSKKVGEAYKLAF